MTDEEIIRIAKEKYPIGTRVNSTGGASNEIVESHNLYWDGRHLRSGINCGLYNKIDKVWAPIVELPTVNNYPIY